MAALAVQHHLVGDLRDSSDWWIGIRDQSRRASGLYVACSGHFSCLGAVTAAGLLAVLDAGGIEGAADDLVADAREVADTAAADEHDRVLLEVVAFARDVGRDLDARVQADTGDLAEGRVRLLRGVRVHASGRRHAAGASP